MPVLTDMKNINHPKKVIAFIYQIFYLIVIKNKLWYIPVVEIDINKRRHPLYCPFSHSNYYSKILKDEEKDLVTAINEQMTCIKCGDKFWIKDSKFFAKNVY